ncbi:MAG: hypothetical protein K8I30_03895, partial [Anaerolineae bacterium]|nr:hypothetical protein [Anaerolineae bacterium]
MQLTGLLDVLRDSAAYANLTAALKSESALPDLGILRAARPFLLSALARDWDGPILYITARIDRAYNVSEQIPAWLGDVPVYRFAEPTPLFYERAPWGETAVRNRIATLSALVSDVDAENRAATAPIIVTSARAIMQRTLPVNTFRKASMTLKPGQRHAIDILLTRWVTMGYEPASIVVEPGTFSRRGGVVDIFPLATNGSPDGVVDKPVRIEFFDDEIDHIRAFDPSTQRSAEVVKALFIPPAREALPEQTPPIGAHLEPWFESIRTTAQDVTNPASDAEPLANGAAFPYLEHYLPYLYPNPISLLDYAPENALIVVEDWTELRDTIAGIEEAAIQTRDEKIESNMLAPDHPLPYITWDALAEELDHRKTLRLGYGADMDEPEADESSDGDIDVGARHGVPLPGEIHNLFSPEERFGGQLKMLVGRLRNMRRENGRIVVVTAQTARVADVWREGESFIPTARDVLNPPPPGSVQLVDGALGEGWRMNLPNGSAHLLTDAEIFGWHRPEPRRRKTTRRARLP